MVYPFDKNELKVLKQIISKEYLPPTISRIDSFIDSAENKENAWKEVFNQLYNIMSSAKI